MNTIAGIKSIIFSLSLKQMIPNTLFFLLRSLVIADKKKIPKLLRLPS